MALTFEKIIDPVRPKPALVQSGEWQVKDAPPTESQFAKAQDGRMLLATDPRRSKLSKLVRRHEMLHVRYSTDDMPTKGDRHQAIYDAMEDCRIHALGEEKHGVDLAEYIEDEEVRRDLSERLMSMALGDATAALYAAMSAYPLLQHNSDLLQDVEDFLRKRLAHEFPTQSNAILARSMDQAKDIYRYPIGYSQRDIKSMALRLSQFIASAEEDKDGPGNHSIRRLKKEGKMPRPGEPEVADYTGENGEWGEMKINEPPRPVHHGSKFRGVSRQRSEMGAVMKHPHHYCTDKAVFENTSRRARGVTVLVDVSGSTDFSQEELEEILGEAKGATVAMYSGSMSSGKLQILAKDEARVGSIPNAPNGNVIDGPALLWLASKHGEKIWVSDGQVRGIDNNRFANLAREAERIIEDNDIYHVGNIKECVYLLRDFANESGGKDGQE